MSPRSPAQLEEVRAATRDRIERAALRVFARAGYAGATVRDVAREAGVAQGLLYNYFDGKQALLAAIFRRGTADVAASFAALAVDAPPAERLAHLVRTSVRLVREHLDFWQLLYGLRHQPAVVAELAGEIAAFDEQVRVTLEQHLRAAGHRSPELQARLLFAAIDGVAQHFAMDPARYPVDAVAERLIEALCGEAPR